MEHIICFGNTLSICWRLFTHLFLRKLHWQKFLTEWDLFYSLLPDGCIYDKSICFSIWAMKIQYHKLECKKRLYLYDQCWWPGQLWCYPSNTRFADNSSLFPMSLFCITVLSLRFERHAFTYAFLYPASGCSTNPVIVLKFHKITSYNTSYTLLSLFDYQE